MKGNKPVDINDTTDIRLWKSAHKQHESPQKYSKNTKLSTVGHLRQSSSCLYFPACLAACVSVSIAVCAIAPVGLSQSADYTHDKPNFLLALHSGSFQALRIPSPGFLSCSLLSLLSFALSFRLFATFEPAVFLPPRSYRTAYFRLVPESWRVGAQGFHD